MQKTIMRDVPVKARKKLPYQDKYEECVTGAWRKLAIQIGKHIKNGGAVEVYHRRLEKPIPGKGGSAYFPAYSYPKNYDIVEVCDVEFQ